MRNNVYKGAEDWEKMNVIEPSFADEIIDTPLPQGLGYHKQVYIVVKGTLPTI